MLYCHLILFVVLQQYGDTVVLVTAVSSVKPSENNFVPLVVSKSVIQIAIHIFSKELVGVLYERIMFFIPSD